MGYMTEEAKYMLRESLIPVLLGDNLRTHLLAMRIYTTCGVVSYICDTKKSLLNAFDPFSRYFPLFSSKFDGVALKSLLYAASNADYRSLLIVCDDKLLPFVKENRELIESRFIICESASLFSSSPLSKLL